MERFFLFIVLLVLPPASRRPSDFQPDLVVMSWNLENFFDWKCDSLSVSEMEFSSYGAKHWTRSRFLKKCSGVSKTIFWAADRYGRLPDVIAVQEIENKGVLRRLIAETPLRKTDYRIVHYDSPDPRGIDCGLLYRSSVLRLTGSSPCHIPDSSGSTMPTRDILLAEFEADGTRLAVLVNHHPSRLSSGSDRRRECAMRRLTGLCDSLEMAGVSAIVAVGDFNRPMDWADPSVRQGTLKYNGVWERIDGCALWRGVHVREDVPAPGFLLTRDSGHGGLKPLRTYSGPRWLGGLSDHLPVIVMVRFATATIYPL